jgi:hypothetical protein
VREKKIFDDYLNRPSFFGRGSMKIPKDRQIKYLEEYIEKIKKSGLSW